MTEAESEVELGAAEEESKTEAATKGLEYPLSPLQHPDFAHNTVSGHNTSHFD